MNDFFNFQDAKDALLKSGAVFLSLASLLVIVALIGAILMLASGGTTESYANTITVTGEAEAMAAPDIARVTATVQRDGTELAAAQEEVTTVMNAIIAGLGEQGIDEEDIATQNYSSNPKYEYKRSSICTYEYCPPMGDQKIVGYEVSHTIVVTVRDLDQTGDIISFLGKQEVSNMYGPEFTIEHPEELQEDVRAEAIADAKEEAKRLAKELGVNLGKLVSFSEGGYSPMYMKAEMAMGGAAYDMDESASVAPELPTGEQEITSNVSLTYRVR